MPPRDLQLDSVMQEEECELYVFFKVYEIISCSLPQTPDKFIHSFMWQPFS